MLYSHFFIIFFYILHFSCWKLHFIVIHSVDSNTCSLFLSFVVALYNYLINCSYLGTNAILLIIKLEINFIRFLKKIQIQYNAKHFKNNIDWVGNSNVSIVYQMIWISTISHVLSISFRSTKHFYGIAVNFCLKILRKLIVQYLIFVQVPSIHIHYTYRKK